jgi:hypothetical protein
MRFTLMVYFFLFSLGALAQTTGKDQAPVLSKEARMVKFLIENKVEPWGKRKNQRAYLFCKNKTGPVCDITVAGLGNELNEVYEVLKGNKALELSQLLIEFGYRPQGKKQKQEVDLVCNESKTTHLPNCYQMPDFRD